MVEGRERPTQSLFPLSDRATTQSICVARYIYRSGNINEVNSHVGQVQTSFGDSPFLKNYLWHIRNGYATQVAQDSYIFGLTVALDSVLTDCRERRIKLPAVDSIDMREYTKVRNRLVGTNTSDTSPEMLTKLSEVLQKKLVEDDSSLRILIDRMIKLEDGDIIVVPEDLHSEVPYLLGIADGYYPLRFAHERVR